METASTPHTPTPPHDGIVSADGAFRLSGMVDQIRDTSRALMEFEVSEQATLRLVSRYNTLCALLPERLTPEAVSFLREVTEESLPHDSDLQTVFTESTLLASALDLLINTPSFVLKRRISITETEKLHNRLDTDTSGRLLAELLASRVTGAGGDGDDLDVPGAYL